MWNFIEFGFVIAALLMGVWCGKLTEREKSKRKGKEDVSLESWEKQVNRLYLSMEKRCKELNVRINRIIGKDDEKQGY